MADCSMFGVASLMNNWLRLLILIELIALAGSLPTACLRCAIGNGRWRQFPRHWLRFFGIGNGFLLTAAAVLAFGRWTALQ